MEQMFEEEGFSKAFAAAREYIPDNLVLGEVADMGDAYWFDYRFPNGELFLGGGIIAVDKKTGEVSRRGMTDEFSELMSLWDEIPKVPVPDEC